MIYKPITDISVLSFFSFHPRYGRKATAQVADWRVARFGHGREPRHRRQYGTMAQYGQIWHNMAQWHISQNDFLPMSICRADIMTFLSLLYCKQKALI